MHLLESLESRQMLSGNITATVMGGSLFIFGDQADNGLVLTEDPSQPGRFLLTGQDDTTINGKSEPVSFSRVIRDIRVCLGDGKNALTVENAKLPRDLMITTKHSDDRVLLQQTEIKGELFLNTGGGNDMVDLIGVTVRDRTNIDTGAGVDIITAEGSTFQKRFFLNTGAGDDVISADSSNHFGSRIITPRFDQNRSHAHVVNKKFDFRKGDFGWKAGYSDYAEGQEEGIQTESGLRQLPSELRQKGTGFYLKSKNIADDVFMYISKRLGVADGLKPNQTYQVRLVIRFASNAPTGAMGVGGAPGESVWLKAGASKNEPKTTLIGRRYESNIDHGEQAQGGTAASLVGNIANGSTELYNTPYVSLERKHVHPYLIQTDAKGNMHIIVGTESGFESVTALYFQEIDVQLIPVSLPPQEKVPTPPSDDGGKGGGSDDPDVKPV